MKYAYTILYVDQVEQTLSAWERAFGFERRRLTDEGDYGELDTGAVVISFAEKEFGRSHFTDPATRAQFDSPIARVEICLTVTEPLEAVYERVVAQGMRPVQSPVSKPWGQTMAWVADPNGILIELATEMPS